MSQVPDSAAWLTQLKEVKGITTDTDAAVLLMASKQSIHQWASGKNQMDSQQAWILANIIGICPLYVIATTGYHGAKNETKRERWLALADTIRPKPTEPCIRKKKDCHNCITEHASDAKAKTEAKKSQR